MHHSAWVIKLLLSAARSRRQTAMQITFAHYVFFFVQFLITIKIVRHIKIVFTCKFFDRQYLG